jgi:hypothetical protein
LSSKALIFTNDVLTNTFDRRILLQADLLVENGFETTIVAVGDYSGYIINAYQHGHQFILVPQDSISKLAANLATRRMPFVVRWPLALAYRAFRNLGLLRKTPRFGKPLEKLIRLSAILLRRTLPSDWFYKVRSVWRNSFSENEVVPDHIPLNPIAEFYEKRFKDIPTDPEVDLVIACDATAAAPAIMHARKLGADLWFDAHEFYSEQSSLTATEKIYIREIEKEILDIASRSYTVNPLLAERMNSEFELTRKVDFLPNSPLIKKDTSRSLSSFRSELNLADSDILLIYHGWIYKGRNLETLSQIFSLPEMRDVHLLIVGYGQLAEFFPNLKDNIHTLPTVSSADLLQKLDGVNGILIPYDANEDINTKYCFPNKVGDAIQMQIPIFANQSLMFLSMLIEKFNIGRTIDFANPKEAAGSILSYFDESHSNQNWLDCDLAFGSTKFSNEFRSWIELDFHVSKS